MVKRVWVRGTFQTPCFIIIVPSSRKCSKPGNLFLLVGYLSAALILKQDEILDSTKLKAFYRHQNQFC